MIIIKKEDELVKVEDLDIDEHGNVVIPNSVTSIGEWAFYGCTSLSSIIIPDSVTSIGEWAFDGCTNLSSITLPNSVTSIGGYAFEDCTSLNSVTIPDSVTSIGWGAFNGCSNLRSINIRAKNKSEHDRIKNLLPEGLHKKVKDYIVLGFGG